MDVEVRLEAVEAENELLREQVARLEGLMGITMKAPIELGLTPHEAGVFGVLMARDMVTKDMVMAAIYRNGAKDEAEIKIVDVFVCKIRKKLKPFGIEIATIWGQGYRLTPAEKQKVRALFNLDQQEMA